MYILFSKNKLQNDVITDEKRNHFLNVLAPNTFILALDGDVDFKPDAVLRLLERMQKNKDVGAACGRIVPMGGGNSFSIKRNQFDCLRNVLVSSHKMDNKYFFPAICSNRKSYIFHNAGGICIP